MHFSNITQNSKYHACLQKRVKKFKGKLYTCNHLAKYIKNSWFYFENIFLKFQFNFRQGLSAQYCLGYITDNGKSLQIREKHLLLFWATCPKLSIASHMISSLLNLMLMGLVSQLHGQFIVTCLIGSKK